SGARAQQQLATATAGNTGAIVTDGRGAAWAAAQATSAVGGLRVVVAQAAPSPFGLWMAALSRFALLAAAPLAAMGVLYMLMRQNAQRAGLAEAEAQRVETHFRIAADGAKVGVVEWRPGSDEIQLSEQAGRLLGAANDTLQLRAL